MSPALSNNHLISKSNVYKLYTCSHTTFPSPPPHNNNNNIEKQQHQHLSSTKRRGLLTGNRKEGLDRFKLILFIPLPSPSFLPPHSLPFPFAFYMFPILPLPLTCNIYLFIYLFVFVFIALCGLTTFALPSDLSLPCL